eukprot:scaffold19985_cov115-Isochrysis_galbana.AAC.8
MDTLRPHLALVQRVHGRVGRAAECAGEGGRVLCHRVDIRISNMAGFAPFGLLHLPPPPPRVRSQAYGLAGVAFKRHTFPPECLSVCK